MSEPNYTLINWREFCEQKWGEAWNVPEVVYRFSGPSLDGQAGSRVFRSTDATERGASKRG